MHLTSFHLLDGNVREETLESKCKWASQKVLQSIQLSSDLQHRGVLRQCLDDLNALLPSIRQTVQDAHSGQKFSL